MTTTADDWPAGILSERTSAFPEFETMVTVTAVSIDLLDGSPSASCREISSEKRSPTFAGETYLLNASLTAVPLSFFQCSSGVHASSLFTSHCSIVLCLQISIP